MRYRINRIFSLKSLIGLFQVTITLLVVIVLYSIISIIFDIYNSSNLTFKLFKTFILNFSWVYKLTFAVLGSFLIVKQLQNSSFSTKIHERRIWTEELNKALNNDEIRNEVPVLKSELSRNSDYIFDFIYGTNLTILDSYQLSCFFSKFIKPHIQSFEEKSIKYERNNQFYTSLNQSYSIEYFDYIKTIILKPDIKYKTIEKDFKDLYFNEVNKFSKYKIKS